MQSNLRIGNRRLDAAARVRSRTGIGAGAFRAHFQSARVVHPRDAAAAGADHVDVYHRRLDRIVRHEPARAEQWLAAIDERHVGAGAADIEGDEVLEPCLLYTSPSPRDS